MVSRLETEIGFKLFRRKENSITLTQKGRRLYAATSTGFSHVGSVLREISGDTTDGNSLTFSVSSAFAMHWFMSHLESFHQAYPGIDLKFHLLSHEPTGPLGDADLAIRYNVQDSEALDIYKLVDEEIVPVCSPSYLKQYGALDAATNIADHTLIHLSGSLRFPWPRVLESMNISTTFRNPSLTFSDYSLVIQAAISGQGVALGWRHVVADKLKNGLLAVACKKTLHTGFTYYLVSKKSDSIEPNIVKVRDWLLAKFQ